MAQRPKAGEAMLTAARVKAEERGGPSGYADRLETGVREVIAEPRRTVGGELMPSDDFVEKTLPAILDTLASPDAVSADASRDRLDLAKNAVRWRCRSTRRTRCRLPTGWSGCWRTRWRRRTSRR